MTAKSTERLSEIRHSLSLAFAALVTGSRTIPLGDNGSLLRELALKSAISNAPGHGSRHTAKSRAPAV